MQGPTLPEQLFKCPLNFKFWYSLFIIY
jgi:hypothetical protein